MLSVESTTTAIRRAKPDPCRDASVLPSAIFASHRRVHDDARPTTSSYKRNTVFAGRRFHVHLPIGKTWMGRKARDGRH